MAQSCYGCLLLIPVNAERSQRVEVRRRMITDDVDRPGADQDERCNHRNDGGADHDVAPFVFAGISPMLPKAIRSGSYPVNSDPHHDVPDTAIGMRSHLKIKAGAITTS